MTYVQKRKSEILNRIAEIVCLKTGITLIELQGEYQIRKVANARKVFCVLIKMYGVRIKEAAEFLKYKHHSSIVTNQQQFFLLFAEDEQIREIFKSSIIELL